MSTVPLTDLKSGACGVIERLEGEEALQKRLADLGLVPGTSVRFIRRAPLGDPLEIEFRGVHLALREKDAKNVLLKV